MRKRWIWSRPKRSMPAGTGGWVVKTVAERTPSRAASKPRPSGTSSRMRSRAGQAGVALVGVVARRLGRPGQPRPQAQGPDAADAEQHLLLQPVLAAAAGEAG